MSIPGKEWRDLKLKRGDLVLIEWEDHCSSCEGWTDVSKNMVFEICFIRTSGFVIYDGNEILKVALNMQQGDEVFCQAMNIVKSCISKITVLE